MTQPADLQKGLVRILTDGGEARRVVGAGFLVSSRHILTCAHVVTDALGIPEDAPAAPTTPVWLDWPLVAGSSPTNAKVACWHPVKAEAKRGELEDIAVLELDGERPLPDATQPVPVVVVEDPAFFDRPVRMYGFAEDRGDWVNGQLQGPVATGWVQLDHELGRLCVAPGFSGTAVWDKRENAAVGMIVSIATRENVRSAYMIPAASLIRAWPALDEHSRPPNPYRGLEAFREQDARYFMGRDRDIQDVLAMLQQRSFVAVVGASGSGKSSLLFAGVVPQLRQQEHWLIADFRPRGDPFRELATALTLLLYPDLDELERLEKRKQLADKLNERSLNLVDVVDLLLKKNPGKRLLLIADQFEELYTQNLAPERQRQFVDELATARTQAKKPAFTLLLALRVDFLGQALDYEPLAEWIKLNHLLLGPLGQAGLEAAIESPARQLGVKLEEGLAERILQDLGQEPGTLPLLEFALTQLWERQQHQRLTHAVYDDIGGVKKALARHADTTLDLLQNEQEQRLRRVFVQLVRPGEGTVDTRQVATREQVGMDNWNLVTELADARLVVTGRDAQGQETVEVVHEALLTHWQKLQGWMKQDRRFRAWQNRLRLDLQEWQKQGRDDGALLRGARLAEAEERLNDHADILSQGEKEYIKASIALREREAIARQRGRRRVITGLVVGLVLALALSGLATWQWWEAVTRRNQALARQLSTQAILKLDNTGKGLIQSALLAIGSLQRTPTPAAYTIWARTVNLLPPERRLAITTNDNMVQVRDVVSGQELARQIDGEWVSNVALNFNGQRLVTIDYSVGFEKEVQIWDVASGQKLTRLAHKDEVMEVVSTPDGQRVATTILNDNIVRVWDVASGQKLVAQLEVAQLNVDKVWRIALSADGQRVATAGEFGPTVQVWDVASSQAQQVQIGSNWQISLLALSPDGQRLATHLSAQDYVRVWDVASGRELSQMAHDVKNSLVFDHQGQRIATTTYDGTVKVWDVATGRELARLIHDRPVGNAAFSLDGYRLITVSDDNEKMVRVWDLGGPDSILTHGDGIEKIAFSSNGQRFATAGHDTIRVWDTANGQELAHLSVKGLTSVALNSDGQRLATASVTSIPTKFEEWASRGMNHFIGKSQIWDVANGQELAHLDYDNWVDKITFIDGQQLVTVNDVMERVQDAVNDHGLYKLSATFSPDGQRLAAFDGDKTVRVWDVASGQELAELPHKNWISNLAFNFNGQRLATYCYDRVVRVWNVASSQELTGLIHKDGVRGVALSFDGQWLATASLDGVVRVWDVASGKELAWPSPEMFPEDAVEKMAFSPDGQRLAIASSNAVRIWLWRAEDVIAETCKRLPRNLTHQEWRQYVGEEVPYHATCPNLPVPEE